MTKTLYVGDPHVMPSNIEDAGLLMDYVLTIARLKKPNNVVILGDLFHTKEVVRGQVIMFWQNWLKIFADAGITLNILVGNHDQFYLGDEQSHSLVHIKDAFSYAHFIHDEPSVVLGAGYLPYIHDKAKFVAAANELIDQGAKFLVCHQTFAGSKFENGFYAPDGINPDDLKANLIISGHIHAAQRFGKVIYPGSPVWLTASDANQEKFIWYAEHGDNGSILAEESFSTENVVTAIKNFDVYEENPVLPTLNPKSKNFITLHGPSSWISKVSKDLKDFAHIRGKPTDSMAKRKASTKDNSSLSKYLETFSLTDESKREAVIVYLRRLGVNGL